ncbi:Evi5 [Phodopus roborovskii]|uniref:Evi5 protein n=1 Tax=Phodopus roborovskii TaxID=109678 RepID=A0AAU9YQZ2_PHORO|nr:Evi5 [Phodopus roborovskii]
MGTGHRSRGIQGQPREFPGEGVRGPDWAQTHLLPRTASTFILLAFLLDSFYFQLIETDSKSLRSVNGSRRNSGSSLVSSSSASSNLSHLEEDSWILWGRIVNEWDDVRKKKEKQVKVFVLELVRKGIPHHFRAIVWQLLCDAQSMPIKDQYSELLKMTSPCEKLIRRDIARTYPEHNFFKEKDSLGQEVLFNVMKMPEEEAFCVFVKLMQDYRLRELFKPSMAELGLCMYQFECMIQEHLPELFVHFQSQSFHTSMYASSWFLTIFLTTFPLPIATRVFDIFMSEGLEIVFRVGLALLQMNQADLMQLDMEGMLQHFQKVIPHQFDGGPDKLIQSAYQVKYNSKKMKKLEKEYTTIKTKEMEEQVEIKVSISENYLIRRELHKCSSTYSEEFVLQLEKELVQARLSEAESQCALKEMQDKVLDIEKKNNSFPDENNIARLQEELIAVKLREAEAIVGLKELRQQVRDLEEHWQRHLARTSGRWKDPLKKNTVNELQDELMSIRLREAETQAEIREMKQRMMEMETQNQINSNQLRRAEQEVTSLQEKVHSLSVKNKGLLTQLSEAKRRQAEIECKLRCLKGQRNFSSQPPFDGIHIVSHLIGDDDSFHSSDEDFIDSSLQESGLAFPLHRKPGSTSLNPALADGSESETEDGLLVTQRSGAPKEQPPQREPYSTTV